MGLGAGLHPGASVRPPTPAEYAEYLRHPKTRAGHRGTGTAQVLGSIAVGKLADLVVLDRGLQLRQVFLAPFRA